MRPVILAICLVVAVASTLYLTFSETLKASPEAINTGMQATQTDEIKENAPLNLRHSSTAKLNTGHHHHESSSPNALPVELEEHIESLRLPASELPVTIHGDGRATVLTENQLSTVLMMVIDEDGTRRMVERQITPKGKIVIPSSPLESNP